MKYFGLRLIRTSFISTCLLLFFITGFCQTTAYTKEDNQQIQTEIHLVEYIASDYPGAVNDGKVLSANEYAEMTEFTNTALKNAERLFIRNKKENTAIIDSLQKLQNIIEQKGAQQQVAFLGNEIKQAIINETGFKDSPVQWPDLTKGKTLYRLNCSSCHGMNGNGKGQLAKTLKPSPADFTDDSLMKDISPFEAYNTIRIGVKGTAMPAFAKLSDQQAWDLAFYVESLRYTKNHSDSAALAPLFDKISKNINLDEVATNSDRELLAKLKGSEARQQLLSLRIHSGRGTVFSPLSIAKQDVEASLSFYQKGNYSEARQKALTAYLSGIEPVEAQLRTNDPGFTSKLEQQMLGMRTIIGQKKPEKIVEKEIKTSLAMIAQANKMLKDKKLTFWLSFLLSASILLREGLEAFLIIAVILALIRKTGNKKALLWIHGGWALAIVAGFLGWFSSDWILKIGGQNREMMEGLVTLFAVVVLTFAGLWLHNKSHAKQWKKFVEEKINRFIQTENMIGLGAFSFMVVFREAFESILFLQAVSLETATKDQASIGLGVLAAFVVIAALLILFLKFSGKIPIRPLFRYSSWMITILAVILIGDGVHAIQEAGFFPVTPFVPGLRLEWIGLYPTVQTILSQISLIVLITGLWYIGKRRLKFMHV